MFAVAYVGVHECLSPVYGIMYCVKAKDRWYVIVVVTAEDAVSRLSLRLGGIPTENCKGRGGKGGWW